MKSRLIQLLPFLGLIALGTSCGEQVKSGGEFSSIDATPTPGVVDDGGGFYVKVKPENGLTTYMHKLGTTTTDFNTPCTIASTDSGKDLECLVNIREHDLYFYGLTLEVNLPRNMCKFFHQVPYYYYNFEPGTGPQNIQINMKSPIADAAPVLDTCSVSDDAGTMQAGTKRGNTCLFPNLGGGSEGSATADGKVQCNYDYTDAEGPNCCYGKYSVSVTTTTITTENQGGTITTKTDTKVDTYTGDYGGKHSNCLAGPAMTNDWPKSKSGYPNVSIYDVSGVGHRSQYKINAGIKQYPGGGNYFSANFFDWTRYKAGLSRTVPKAITPANDRSGTSIYSGNPAYTYACVDESGEVKNRIRVYVNEWNTNAELTNYVSSKGASGNPNITGDDGINCEAGSSVTGKCNDFGDWDDTPTGFPSEAP